MDLLDYLKFCGLEVDANKKVKLLRHKDSRVDINDLIRLGQFNYYQAVQKKPILHNCDYMVSFLGLESSESILFGVYKINKVSLVKKEKRPKNFLLPEICNKDDIYFYHLEKLGGFEELENRLIIDWGKSTRSWVQWAKPKKVVELLPAGYVKSFTGLLDFTLWYEELVQMVKNPSSNREWHRSLSSISGIYLILDTLTGDQYVGSAYGKDGVLGRWSEYARTGHGGNKQLKALLTKHSDYAKHFKFTLLRGLEKTLTKKEVISEETLWKIKLGSRVFGLNEN